jgi:glutamate-1-semialdehyde 2,1-aminomutase
MKYDKSLQLNKKATSLIPGGVNSPVRACKSVGADPLFIQKAAGCLIYDADGNEYIDYVGSWGPMILGHRHPDVIAAVQKAVDRGLSYGAPTEAETLLAELIIEAVPSMEMVRMVNSGTEATMSAIRLARGYTGRNLIIKFDGCYHGHADTLLVEAGSGVATLGIAGSPGVPDAFVKYTLSLPYNDIETFKTVMQKQGSQVACIIVEPVAGNMGLVLPVDGFLETLREECDKHGSLLIFDEVMTGFRVAHGGAQAHYNTNPDLTTLGKIIGGGMPVGAYGGKKQIMNYVAPQGSIYQAGTLSGNPVAMAAGIATLELLRKSGFYEALDQKADMLATGLKDAARHAGIDIVTARAGSMLGLYFTSQAVNNYEDAKTSNLERFSAYYQGMREKGIYLAPSQFEAAFVSAAHDDRYIQATIDAAREVMPNLS